MEALSHHKHPLEQVADAAKFVVSHLAGGGWADLPRPTLVEVPPLPELIVLPNLTAIHKAA